MVKRNDLKPEEYDPYFNRYLNLVDPDADLYNVLEQSLQESLAFLDSLEKPLDYAYAPEKWSIGAMIQHNIDTERVFQYRALRFLRGDDTPLAGFDQDLFSKALVDTAFAKAELAHTLNVTRQHTLAIFKEATQSQLGFMGTASGKKMSARVIPFLIAGHSKHHEQVISERYCTS